MSTNEKDFYAATLVHWVSQCPVSSAASTKPCFIHAVTLGPSAAGLWGLHEDGCNGWKVWFQPLAGYRLGRVFTMGDARANSASGMVAATVS